MKIAVLSDIHGNMEALEAVLKDITKREIKDIYICGDLAMAGSEPAKTIDFIRNELEKKFNLNIIQGNTDEMIAKLPVDKNSEMAKKNMIMTNALEYAQKVLNYEQKNFLASLPVKKSINLDKINILLVHGSPRRNNEDIMPAESVEKIREMISETTEDVIFCGHTHLPAGYQVDKQTVVNVGSVGRPFSQEPKACYAILNYPDKNKNEYEIEHIFIDYDYKTAAKKLEKLPFNGADKLARMLEKATSRYPV
ncbi:MAG: metallophosphoesterase family protein [Candidatus Gastranaerophilales bacterium]|nr:metallophosphoesterase family protein [Candidatus Gastranaerophilales bacterium]